MKKGETRQLLYVLKKINQKQSKRTEGRALRHGVCMQGIKSPYRVNLENTKDMAMNLGNISSKPECRKSKIKILEKIEV